MVEELWAGRYRRDRLLGRGAMGEVWAAFDVVLDRPVAIKSISATRTDPDDQQRMAREARVAARIGHPNAVAVHDLLMVDDRPNLVMEYVEGDTLAERIKRNGRVDPRQVAGIGAAVADALAEAHRLGIVHRDIKPANILITPRGVPKLADFGIARVSGEAHMTATGMMVGTPAYMAPEIVHGGPADARSDIWSLGVTLYAALEGSPPFVLGPDDEPMAVLGRVLHAPIRPPSCGGALARVVSTMLDRDPARRPSARAVSELLGDRLPAALDTTRLRGPAVTQQRPPVPPGPPVWSSQTRTGPAPIPPGTWSDDYPGPYPGHGAERQPARRTGRVLAVVAVVVLLLAAGTVGYLVFRSNDRGSSVAAGNRNTSPAPVPSAGSGSPSTSSSPSTSTGSDASSSPTTDRSPSAGEDVYSGPGGLTVRAPAGWTVDNGAHNPNVLDYDAPGTNSFLDGESFQIGIGHDPALPTIEDEFHGARKFLRGAYHDVSVEQPNYGIFLGDDAVTFGYVGTSDSGHGTRHGMELLWLDDSVLREIILSAPADRWATARPVFDGLIDSARVID